MAEPRGVRTHGLLWSLCAGSEEGPGLWGCLPIVWGLLCRLCVQTWQAQIRFGTLPVSSGVAAPGMCDALQHAIV